MPEIGGVVCVLAVGGATEDRPDEEALKGLGVFAMRSYDIHRALRIGLLCSSVDAERQAICGIRVDKWIIEATDGHRIVRVTLPESTLQNGFATNIVAKRYAGWLEGAEERVRQARDFTLNDTTLFPLSKPDRWPDTDRIWAMKGKSQGKTIAFNPAYLATLPKIWDILTADDKLKPVGLVRLELSAEPDPAYFELKHDGLTVEYMVMPMRLT